MKNVKKNIQTNVESTQDQKFLEALKKISGQDNVKAYDFGGPRRDIGPRS